MSHDVSTLYMVEIWLDTRRLIDLGRMLHLPLARTGTNYLVHCGLQELFQDQSPSPFSIEHDVRRIQKYAKNGQGRFIRVLGYTQVDAQSLQNVAKGFASPLVYQIADWERVTSKPMPDEFPAGMQLGFELRACPVIQKASDGPKWNKGQEVDAFLDRVWEVDDPDVNIEREDVYRDWLKKQLSIRGGAQIIEAGLQRFSLERMTRRTHGENRKVNIIKRPDITLAGKLEVTESEAFQALLHRGIGQHKSFGYGMLKLRRA